MPGQGVTIAASARPSIRRLATSFSIPSFSAAGGDGYPKIDTINAGLVDAGVLKDYIAAKKTILVADYQPSGEVELC